MKWYLAGPMSNLPQFNFPAFYAAAAALRTNGYDIISPAELDDEEDSGAALKSADGDMRHPDVKKTWGSFLARDVKIVADEVGGIIFLPGWEKSRGARLEAYTATLCGHKFAEYVEGGTTTPLETQWVKDQL